MHARTHAALLALALTACASHEGPSSTGQTPPTPPTPKAAVTVAVASVQLIQDCPDPPEPAAQAAEKAVAPAQPVPEAGPQPAAAAQAMPAPGAALAQRGPGGPGGFQQPCTQSTVQLSLTNTGEATGKLRVQAVRLLDSDGRELGTLQSRKPSLWGDAAGYAAWDETIPQGATVKAAYRLGDPDWSKVEAQLPAGTNIYARPLMLELELGVDGATQTVRSPVFTRQQVIMIVT